MIVKLDEAVVLKIAAGEVIQRPFNAIKEMMENCIDAKATCVNVSVRDAGFKSLQVQDNGSGIDVSDLNLLCTRFATSKISQFDDLQNLCSFGFRGEALASISHVAHVTVTTRTNNVSHAFKASYKDGILNPSKPVPIAGNIGTQILVEDLFYNMPTRKKALKNLSEEYSKIYEVVSRYAVQYPLISFTLKKMGAGLDLNTSHLTSTKSVIQLVFGPEVASELLEISKENALYSFKMDAWRAFDAIYAKYLPKHAHPFCYLSLQLLPQHLDVNVHPTKKVKWFYLQQVHFLNEGKIIELMCEYLDIALGNANASRSFNVKNIAKPLDFNITRCNTSAEIIKRKMGPKEMVRTDSKSRTLDHFFQSQLPQSQVSQKSQNSDIACESLAKISQNSSLQETIIEDELQHPLVIKEIEFQNSHVSNSSAIEIISKEPFESSHPYTDVNYSSIKSIISCIKAGAVESLTNLFRNHTLIGTPAPSWVLIQYRTKLFMCGVYELSRELFYQLGVIGFANYGLIQFQLTIDKNISNLNILLDNCEMLNEYFNIRLVYDGSEVVLSSLPLLLSNHIPNFSKLRIFLEELIAVNYTVEEDCFDGIFHCIANFYAFEEVNETECELIMSAVKSFEYNANGKESVVEVADLPDLYKVFERC